MLHIAYDDRLLGWRLGKGHPTNPVRAKNAITLLEKRGVPNTVHRISGRATRQDMQLVHDASYVGRLINGRNDEWSGQRKDLGNVARLMFQGTVDLVDMIVRDEINIGFSPMGAKHHAQRDHGSGFCALNDFAWAARSFAALGMRVAYVDMDAHHGDGVELLTYDDSRILTASVHEWGIFPGTGHDSDADSSVFNYPLPSGADDIDLHAVMSDVLTELYKHQPDVLLVAVGGDGHAKDPLSSLGYTYAGYADAGHRLGDFAGAAGIPVLIGGAGGYRPHDFTPGSWAAFTSALHSVYTGALV